MQIKQTIPLYSFYRWDDTLFDLLEVPDGIDKDKLIDNILLEAGERSVIYSDPEFLKNAIGIWSNTYQATFERWAKALAIEYDPLENYDRREEWTDERNTETSTEDTQTTEQTTSGTNTQTRVAYPDNQWHDGIKDVDSGSQDVTVNGSGSGTGSETAEHEGRIHGNIGVTTSQQMLQSELDLGYWNIIVKITDLFIENFIIMIY